MTLRAALIVASIAAPALARPDAVLRFGPAGNPNPEQLHLTLDLGPDLGVVNLDPEVPPMADPTTQRDICLGALDAAGLPGLIKAPDAISCVALPYGSFLSLHTQRTAATDSILCPEIGAGATGFSGQFDPLDINGQPAIFTAGIVTDVGELTAQVSAQELNFQTDGPIICQALFQRLAPQAPQFGAQINYAGDRLEIYFDPAYTVFQGGIIFGTTSPSNGAIGGLFIEPPAAPPVAGIYVCPPQHTGEPTDIRITIDDTTLDIPIPSGASSESKRNSIILALAQAREDLRIAMQYPNGLLVYTAELIRVIELETLLSAEDRDRIIIFDNVGSGSIHFENTFEPFDYNGLPAIFTAGIVTDVGELTVQVSAEELDFQTEGPIICQALFQRLAPRAPDYGADLFFAGDRLEVYFDPAYSVTQGGITFGTSSTSAGASGVVDDTPICPADIDGNGRLNVFDFLMFQSLFSAGDLAADFAPPYGVLNVFDFLEFANWYAEGCK